MGNLESNNLSKLFFIPSFYGSCTWGIWLTLYLLELLRVDDCSYLALSIFIFIECMFVASLLISFKYYDMQLSPDLCGTTDYEITRRKYRSYGLLLLHVAGYAGIVKYVMDFSCNMGGLPAFFFALINESYAVRLEAELSSSIGFQLSYFGWIAIGLTLYFYKKYKISRWWLLLAFVQFLGNLMFIDRTRPIWIGFTAVLMILPTIQKIDFKKTIRWMAVAVGLMGVIFWAIASWSGKLSYKAYDEKTILPGITQEIYIYGVSGFAYFNRMLEENEDISYRPLRIIYPIQKFLAILDLVEEPPSRTHDIYYEVPFTTNAGSFLEPFYRDGGLIFVFWGIIIYSFGIDALAKVLLKVNSPLALYGWSNLCFVSFISFYNPKLEAFPTWIFLGMGLSTLVFSAFVPKYRAKPFNDAA